MKSKSKQYVRRVLSSLAVLLMFGNAVFAGPPLICHPFDIGNAKSLPFISHDWNLSGGENYNMQDLANDTVAILNGSQVPLVHMETLRRATLYARKDSLAAKQLLLKIVARARSSEATSAPDAFALFDAAYLAEAYKQWLGEKGENPANGLDSATWIQKAMQIRPNDAQLAFGAALITLRGTETEQHEYAQRATAGAKNDALLARNLSTHFLGEQSQTMAEMIARGNSNKMARQ
jgi:hypothetical protein